MKIRLFFAGLVLVGAASAAGPKDYARQWPVIGSCQSQAGNPATVSEKTLDCEGAFAVALDESVYRQVQRADLGDLAAFNADGEALPLGPMPESYNPPPGSWQPALWFPLPRPQSDASEDLHLHVQRTPAGELSFDATLRHGVQSSVQDVLIDVRAKDRDIEAIALELALDAADFSAEVSVEGSEDLQEWHEIVPAAAVAQLRQGGQTLTRRHIELPPQSATYLRLHVLGASEGIPLLSVKLLLHPLAASTENLKRTLIAADFVRRDGAAYIYHLPARIPVERVNVVLGDDNAIANFGVSARDAGQRDWSYVGQLNAFRLRGAGVQLDNEPMDVATTRLQEWRIEPSIELVRTPVLELAFRPESWLLLTHGKPPFVVAAGSSVSRRSEFPLEALVGQVRAKYGRDWQPLPASLGAMQTAGGEAALTAYDPEQKKTWLLWAILVLGAGVIVVMVLRLLKSPPD